MQSCLGLNSFMFVQFIGNFCAIYWEQCRVYFVNAAGFYKHSVTTVVEYFHQSLPSPILSAVAPLYYENAALVSWFCLQQFYFQVILTR